MSDRHVTSLVAVGAAALRIASVSGSSPTSVTFAKDVGPILSQQCASCHRPDGSAPFSLLPFADPRPRAKAIAAAVRRRTMPPWKPEAGYGDFIGAARPADEQIRAIVPWADHVCPPVELAA